MMSQKKSITSHTVESGVFNLTIDYLKTKLPQVSLAYLRGLSSS